MNASGQIYTLIPKVMSDIGGVEKNRRNEQQKYAFRGIEDFYQAAHPALIAHGVFCVPQILERNEYRFEKTNEQGRITIWLHVTVKVSHKFYAPDGSFVDVITPGEGLDNSDKASNKAMSGAMKYALIELFCVPTRDIEDADRATYEQGSKEAQQAVLNRKLSEIHEQEVVNKKSPNIYSREENIRAAEYQTLKTKAVPDPNDPIGLVMEPAPNIKIGVGITKSAPAKAAVDEILTTDTLTTGQQQDMHVHFRQAIPESLKMRADEYFYQWLLDHGFVDETGPTTKVIQRKTYAVVHKAMMAYARSLSE